LFDTGHFRIELSLVSEWCTVPLGFDNRYPVFQIVRRDQVCLKGLTRVESLHTTPVDLTMEFYTTQYKQVPQEVVVRMLGLIAGNCNPL
jgi:hypothetical protein